MSDKVREAREVASDLRSAIASAEPAAFGKGVRLILTHQQCRAILSALDAQGAEERREGEPAEHWPLCDCYTPCKGCWTGAVSYAAPPSTPTAAVARDWGTPCRCETCAPITFDDMRMVLCPLCGNKRCPHATDHRLACTRSNEPGQWGSSYGVLVSAQEAQGSAERATAAAPEYVMVPREPTEAMLRAGKAADYSATTHDVAAVVWRAMLDASQPGAAKDD